MSEPINETRPQETHRAPSIPQYLAVYVALMVLLILTVGASFIDLGRFNTTLALIIAIVKAVLIILIFMHVRYQPRLMWFFAGAGFLWLGILITLSNSDYLTRNLPRFANQRGEPTYLQTQHPEDYGIPHEEIPWERP
jgi:cytochrome c oxidase subunit 4